MTAVADWVTTARSVHDLARQTGIDMPITREVFAVLFESKSPTDSVMQRPPRGESNHTRPLTLNCGYRDSGNPKKPG